MQTELCDRLRLVRVLAIVLVVGTALLLSSCASSPPSPETAAASVGAVAPEWHAGDRWCHAWAAGTEKGSKSSEVIGMKDLGGVQYYVVRVGNVDRYYTKDLAWAANVMDNRVAARAVPPQPWFMWPLEAGKHWEYKGTFEDRDRKDQMNDSYSVVGKERVVVPAGVFQAIKVVRDGGAAGSDQYWYSPEVRWYVKWTGRRGMEEFQEVLESCVAPAKGASARKP